MNADEFEEIFERQVEQSRSTLVDKAKQYADDTDRLHNFKVAAALKSETPEQALWGFEVKHLVSISDMVRKDNYYPPEVWDEKIGDAINYLILLRAQVFETDNKRTSSESTETDPSITPQAPPTINVFQNFPPGAVHNDDRYDPLS